MGPVLQWVDENAADPLTLDVYPSSKPTSYTFYEDDGVSDRYLTRGEFATTVFSREIVEGRETFSIEPTKGSFAGKLAARTYILKFNRQRLNPAKVTRGNDTLTRSSSRAAWDGAEEGWYYDAAAKIVWVKFRLVSDRGVQIAL